MKKQAGVWIDYEKAVIFILANEGAEIKRVRSGLNVGVQPFSTTGNERGAGTPGKSYYDEVISYIRAAESILIFGPGEAKLELKKRLEDLELEDRIVGMETVFKMTDNEIVTKVRQRFIK